MEIIFLGTSSMVPTKDRNHTGILLSYKNEGLLFDCGEGIQRQMKIQRISLNKITKIFITHFDGDHVLGLAGMFFTMNTTKYNRRLKIFGPKGIKEFVKNIIKTYEINMEIEYNVEEIKKQGKIIDSKDYSVEAYELEHGKICYGYCFKEKDRRKINMQKAKKYGLKQGPLVGKLQLGKTIEFKGKKIKPDNISTIKKGKIISIVMDTVPCNGCLKTANNADILIIESSFTTKHEEKAAQYKHMTAKQAALIAHKANVKKLILTHFSQRYKDTNEIKEEAEDIFSNVVLAYDFLKIKL